MKAPQISFLTLAQIYEQLHALRFRPQLQTMVAVLIYAGLRREELVWLTVDDVDLSRRHAGGGGHGLIRVRAKTISGKTWQPKTGVNRAVPISRALRGYLDRYTPIATTSPATDQHFRGWFFPSPGCGGDTGGGLFDVDNFSRLLRNAIQDAGLSWSSLDFRHTFGANSRRRASACSKLRPSWATPLKSVSVTTLALSRRRR